MNKHFSISERTRNLTQLALLSAIIIVMSFTPLGYLRTLGLEITFIMIPVVIGAAILGPVGGAILGGVFGITSFIQCFGISAFGTTLLGINPIFTFIGCIVPRVLAGLIPGLISKALRGSEAKRITGALLSSLVGPICNTVFFMSLLIIFFGNTDYIQGFMTSLETKNFFIFAVMFVGVQGLVEAIVAFVVGSAISVALIKAFKIKK